MTRIRSPGPRPLPPVHDAAASGRGATPDERSADRHPATAFHAAPSDVSRAPGPDDAHVLRAGDITLEQLLDRLRSSARDPGSHRAAAPLMALIASDIRAGLQARPTGLPRNPARSLRAWRERYNGLGRDLQDPA